MLTKFRKNLIICLLVQIQGTHYAAFENLVTGANCVGMGSVETVGTLGPECLFSNPSRMGETFSLFFSTARPFELSPLAYHTTGLTLPFKPITMGIGLLTFGDEKYHENTFIIGGARRVTQKWIAGLSMKILHLHIERYGTWTGIAIDGGISFAPLDHWTLGIAVNHLTSSKLSPTSVSIGSNTRIGIQFEPEKGFWFAFELDKNVRYPLELRGGMEWQAMKNFVLRFGMTQNPSSISGGIGYTFDKIRLDYACHFHPQLGISHYGSVSMTFSRKNQDAWKY